MLNCVWHEKLEEERCGGLRVRRGRSGRHIDSIFPTVCQGCLFSSHHKKYLRLEINLCGKRERNLNDIKRWKMGSGCLPVLLTITSLAHKGQT